VYRRDNTEKIFYYIRERSTWHILIDVNMEIQVLAEAFSICRLKDYASVDMDLQYVFTGSTDEEKSLVCPTLSVPAGTLDRSDGWRAFRIEGVLDFSLVGILARISDILARGGIGIFAISTFNTDYILTKGEQFEEALRLLSSSGYDIKY